MRHYAFDIDVNLFYIPSKIMMERYEEGEWKEEEVDSEEFVKKNERDDYRISTQSDNAFFHFRDDDILLEDFSKVMHDWPNRKGPSFDKFRECIVNGNDLALITARGQSPHIIRIILSRIIFMTYHKGQEDWGEGVSKQFLDNIDIYPVSSEDFNNRFGTDNHEYSVSYKKKLAFRDFLEKNYDGESISMGFSDDDPKNVRSIQELIEDELMHECPKCHFVLYNTSEHEVKKYPLTTKFEKEE